LARVSIIVPIFNAERWLAEALLSVTQQDFEDWELLLVDDGSTDESGKIAESFTRELAGKARLFRHLGNINRGQAASRNLALAHVRGEFTALLDADDLWLASKLSHDIDLLGRNPTAAAVFSAAEYFFENGTAPVVKSFRKFGDQLVPPPDLLREAILLDNERIPCPCSATFRTSELRAIGGFDENFSQVRDNAYEDQVIFSRLWARYPVYISAKCLSRYRRHPDSVWSKAQISGDNKIRLEFLSVLKTIIEKAGDASLLPDFRTLCAKDAGHSLFAADVMSPQDWDLVLRLEEVPPEHPIHKPLHTYRCPNSSLWRGPESLRRSFCSQAIVFYKAYLRRKHKGCSSQKRVSFFGLPQSAVIAWMVTAVEYSLDLGEPWRAMFLALRGVRIAPLNGAAWRSVVNSLQACMRLPAANSKVSNCADFVRLKFYPVRLGHPPLQSNTGNIEPDRIVCIPPVHKPGHCLFGGENLVVESGHYKVTCKITAHSFSLSQDSLVVLDVYENLKINAVLAERQIKSEDLARGSQSFSLEFAAKEGLRVEFRVWWAGQCFLSVSQVILHKMQRRMVGDADKGGAARSFTA
jgi:glycosyltransferase involved in cell wall biosynthesis